MKGTLRAVGLSIMALCLLAALAAPLWREPIVRLIERTLSPDKHLSASGQHTLVLLYFFITPFAFLFGLAIFWCRKADQCQRLWAGFTRDSLVSMRPLSPSPTLVILGSTLAGALPFALFHTIDKTTSLYVKIFREDGVTEWSTVILYFVSMIFMATYLYRAHSQARSGHENRIALAFGILLIMGMIFLIGEELSWGQRIFGWQTPEAFALNQQNETNLHNLPRSFMQYPERILALLPLFCLIPLVPNLAGKSAQATNLIMPHPSLLPLSIIISFSSFFFWFSMEETIELMTAIFSFFYCMRIFYYSKSL